MIIRYKHRLKQVLLFSALIGLFAILNSCIATKKYTSPYSSTTFDLYRTDSLFDNENNIADTHWSKLFTDSLLKKYIQNVLDSNFDLQIAIQNIKIAKAYLQQSRALFSPTMAIAPTLQYQSLSQNTPQGSGTNKIEGSTAAINTTFTWELDIWGKLNSQKKAALASYLKTNAAQQVIQSNLIALTATNYYQLLSLDAQKNILNETIETISKSFTTIKSLKDEGSVSEIAVLQSKAQLLNAKAQILLVEKSIRELENSFSALLAQEPHAIIRATLNEQVVNTPLSIGVPSELLSKRPDVLAAEYQFKNAFELTNVARTSFYPSLNINATTGLQSIDFDKLFSAQSIFANVLGSLTQPIWNQRKIRSQYEAALAQQQIALLNFKKTTLNASKEVSDALYNFKTQDKLYHLKQQEFTSLDTATSYSQDLLKYGMATYLDVLTAQQNALNAKQSFINAAYGRLESIVNLYKSLGGGR